MNSLAHAVTPLHSYRLPIGRTVGHSADGNHRYSRIVDSLTIFDEPLDFRTLCSRVLEPDTHFLVLDLDRTTHLDRNLGELLGWELEAHQSYGTEKLNELTSSRVLDRLFLDPRAPLRTLSYLVKGVASWAYPGLTYALGVKLAAKFPGIERLIFREFGPDSVTLLQRCIQTAMLHRLAGLDHQELYRLAESVWNRLSEDQVIERADIAWLRARFPRLRIVITSASPRPMLEVARDQLGVDAIFYSSAISEDANHCSPFRINRRYQTGRLVKIAAPSKVLINSGRQKIENLLKQYPFIGSPDCNIVGISDTRHGEDHCWSQFFTRVVDVNSNAPFAPIVAHDSPLREVFSARLLPRKQRTNIDGEVGLAGPIRRFDASALQARLSKHAQRIEAYSTQFFSQNSILAKALDRIELESKETFARLEELVEHFNDAEPYERKRAVRMLRRSLRHEARLRREDAKVRRPLSDLQFRIAEELRDARKSLEFRP